MPMVDLVGFANLMLNAAVSFGEQTETMEEVGRLVEAKAKSLIGDQAMLSTDIAPLETWRSLAPATEADRLAQGYDATSLLLRTGEMRDSITHSAGPMEARVGSDNKKLLWQERGTELHGQRYIPPRSVLGAAVILLEDKIAEMIWLGHARVLQGGTKGQSLNSKSYRFTLKP